MLVFPSSEGRVWISDGAAGGPRDADVGGRAGRSRSGVDLNPRFGGSVVAGEEVDTSGVVPRRRHANLRREGRESRFIKKKSKIE